MIERLIKLIMHVMTIGESWNKWLKVAPFCSGGMSVSGTL
jgi:hypothetical protein